MKMEETWTIYRELVDGRVIRMTLEDVRFVTMDPQIEEGRQFGGDGDVALIMNNDRIVAWDMTLRASSWSTEIVDPDDRWEVVCPWPQPTGPRWPSPALYDEYRWGTSGNKYTRDVMDAGYFIDLMTRIPNHFSKEVVPT